MANTVIIAGQSRVQPSVYLIPTAQTTSNKPAIKRINQDKGCWDFECRMFDVRFWILEF